MTFLTNPRRLSATLVGVILTTAAVGACSAAPAQPAAAPPSTVTITRYGNGGPPSDRGPGALPTGTTTTAPAAGTVAAAAWEALMGPEGEYAAAAAYQAVIATFGPVEPYVSIEAMEQQHITALIRQLGRLGYTAPANPYVGTIPAPADLTAAATAWAAGERANVAMYDRLAGDAGLSRVFGNLRRSSLEAHLPLFEAAAAHAGTLTEAQMLELGFVRH